MKTALLITTVLLTSLATLSFAEEPEGKPGRGRGMSPEKRLERMTEHLGLTPEQVEKLKPILEAEREKVQAIRADKDLAQEDRRAKMREIRRENMEAMKAVLTPEQQEKAKEMMKKRREGGPEGKEKDGEPKI